jgi:hypothetical protein
MPALDWKLTATLVVVLALMQAAVWLLARGLGLRLPRRVMAAGMLAPLVLLAPWLSTERLLVTSDILRETIPRAPQVDAPEPHGLLNDVIYQILPWELEVRHALSERRLPFWSDLLEGGSSPWANPQAGPLSPLAMAARAFPIQHHLLAMLALKILLAFEGTWLLARRVGRTRAASFLAAGGFALGGGLSAWALFPITATVAFVPWLALGTIGLFRRPSRRVIAATAVITAALLLSGHPETAAIGGLFAAVCGLCLRRRPAGFGRGLGAAAAAALLGFALAAPHLLPFLSIVPDSHRAHATLRDTLPDYYFRLSEPLTWFVPGYGQFMLAPTSPHAFGRPYRDPFQGPINWADVEPGYTGLLAFAAAAAALLAVRDRRARPFLGFALLSLLLAARFLPLAHVIDAIPPLRVPAYARFLPVGSLALCLAAAFGIDFLLARPRRVWLGWAGLALAAVASLAVTIDPWVIGLWAALGLAFGAALWRPRVGAALLGLVLLVDLIPWSRSLLPTGHPALFYPRTEFTEMLTREAGDSRLFRAVGAEYLVYPSVLPVYGIAEVRPHNPLVPQRYLEVLDAAFEFSPGMGTDSYFDRFAKVDHPLLDFLGVRAVVASVAMPPSKTLELRDGGRFAPFFLYGNPDPLPRWFLPAAVDVIDRGAARGWIAGLKDPRRVAVFADEAGAWRPAARGPVPLEPLAATPGRVTLAVPPGEETLLATSIPWSKGWSARVGGRKLPTLTVNGAFVGVRLPSGVSQVELRFRPPGFVAGAVLFGIAIAVTLFLLFSPSPPGRGGQGVRSGVRRRPALDLTPGPSPKGEGRQAEEK